MKSKKHPKYQAKKIPRTDCKSCGEMWYRSPHRLIVNKWLGTPPGYNPIDEEERLDPPCDARAYAERHDFGGSDAGGRSRG